MNNMEPPPPGVEQLAPPVNSGVEQNPPPGVQSLPRPRWFHQQPGDGWQQQQGQFPWQQQPLPNQFYTHDNNWQQQQGQFPWQQQPFANQWQQSVQPRKPYIDLPTFWCKDPASWFRLADAAFGREQVVDRKLKFDITLKFLSEDTVEQIRDLLRKADSVEDPYAVLKGELIRLCSPNVLEQLNGIVYAPELGGQTPTQLMNKLLSLLPAGEPAGLLFKHHFVLRMPSDIRDQVAKKIEKLEVKELAEYADSRWHVRNSRPPVTSAVAAVEPLNVDALTEAVAAVSTGGGKNNRRNNNNRRGGKQKTGERDTGKAYICLKHCRFGKEAWSCDDQRNCSFQGNGGAGGQ